MGDSVYIRSWILTYLNYIATPKGPRAAGPWNDEPNEASVREPPESAVSAVTPRRGRSTWKGKGKGGYQDGYLGC